MDFLNAIWLFVCDHYHVFIDLALAIFVLLVTLLSFGLLQMLIMFAVSVAVAFLASFMPVRRIARKKPVDAIKDR